MHDTILTDRTARTDLTTTVVTPPTPRHYGGHPPDIIA